MQNFAELNLNPAIAQAITELKFDQPTPIQAEALPLLLDGETDFLGMAATGTGKTAAFGIPLLQKIKPEDKGVQAVILCPTRELAIQTARQISALGKHMGINVPAIYGGGRFYEQRDALRTAPIIVATPGRLIDHLEQGNVSLEKIKTLVLDEADEMISMGFEEALETILGGTSRELCRTWLFSATLPAHLKHVAETYMKNPKRVHLNSKSVLSGTVQQVFYTVRDRNKAKGLCKLIDWNDDFYGLIFVQTKIEAHELTQFLRSRRYAVDSLHGDKEQAQRERTLGAFRTRQVNILVCTDVAARGLDVADLTHVVNFSLPNDIESYVHRIGRTGRGGKQGVAMSLVEPRQLYLIPRIEKRTRVRVEQGIFPSRKSISAKMLTRFLPKFVNAQQAEKALEILDENWSAKLAEMSREEIASRFLAMALPELFEDDDMDEREPKRRNDSRQNPYEAKKSPRKPAREFPPLDQVPAPAPYLKPKPAKVEVTIAAAPRIEHFAALEVSAPIESQPVMAEALAPVESSVVVEAPTHLSVEIETAAPVVAEVTVQVSTSVEAAAPRENEVFVPAVEVTIAPSEGKITAAPTEKKFFIPAKKPFHQPIQKPVDGEAPMGERRFGKREFSERPQGQNRGFGDRAQHADRGPRREFGGDRPPGGGFDRGPRQGGFGGPRRDFGGGRPPGGGFERGPRREFGGDRPPGGGFDRGPRQGGFGGPRREFGGDRPQGGSFDRGPRRDFGGPPRGDRPFGGGGGRSFENRGGFNGGGGGRPFGDRPAFDRKPFGAPRKPGFMMDGKEVFLNRKPIERKQGAGKPFARKVQGEGVIPVERAEREFTERREFAGGRPSFGGGNRPFGRKPPFGGGGGRPFGGGKKPFGRKPFGASAPHE